MSETFERRNPKISRVELATLVDICARDTSLPPFQGQSGNISGRGMHVRTSHLPEIGMPLVCRFEHDDREVLVEGRVAWRSEGQDGGEFGIQFTAVDADSAEILRSLRPMSSVSSAFKPRMGLHAATEDDDDEEDEQLLLKSGDRVRLHIDGLAAPMKASVHESTRQKVRLGSSLEFLKVGRPVEIESASDGERRGAKVDSVNVVLNPSNSVPELVVMLRYDGESASPAPAVTQDLDRESQHFGDDDGDDEASSLSEATDILKSKVLGALGKAQGALSWAKDAARQVGRETKRTVHEARAKMHEHEEAVERERPKVLRAQTPRRTTPPGRASNVARAGFVSKRTTAARDSGRQSAPAQAKSPRPSRLVILGGGTVALALALGSWAMKGEPKPSLSHTRPAEAQPSAETPMASAAPAVAAPPAAIVPAAAKPSPEGIVAEVPLFGPRPIATSEPLTRPPENEALAEKRAAAASVPDEKFPEAERAPTSHESSTTWGRGQLNLPTVHRIRLDAAGSEVVGVAEPNGFAIVVPGRKAMETGRAIEKRDRRILHVKTSNTAEGARINFSFRGPVPPYRVRLKNDFVEFFVSAPEGMRGEL